MMRKGGKKNQHVLTVLTLSTSSLTFTPSFPSFLPFSTPPHLSLTEWCGAIGNGSCNQFITLPCCSILLTLFPCSSVWSLPQNADLHKFLHRSPFHVVQSLRNRLLQCVSPTYPSPARKSAPVISPWGCVSHQEPSAAWALRGLQLPLGQIHLLHHGLFHKVQHGDPCWCWVSKGCVGTACNHRWSFPCAAGESLIQHLKDLILLHWPWCLQGCFLRSFSLTLLLELLQWFVCFLKHVITEVVPASVMGPWWACPEVDWNLSTELGLCASRFW